MPTLTSILKYYYTIKELRFEQIWFRILYRFKKPKVNHSYVALRNNSWRWSGPCIFQQSLFFDNQASFLSLKSDISNSWSWNDSTKDKLWLYNLHYFDDLNSISFKEREGLHYEFINRWISENPPCFGNGWEPYPTSLRLVNWVKWFSKKDNVSQKYLISIANQAYVLSQQFEYHILGNHLFANAKALTFVGVYLNGKEGDIFLEKGLKYLDREIKEQFLADGAHFELTPMYHEILLWDLLELIDLALISQNKLLLKRVNRWSLVAKKALEWLDSMVHPDGEISFFNDAAIGIAASPAEISNYARKLNIECTRASELVITNNESGYTRIQNENYTLFFDHANVGPKYLPGHAHADSLSIELSVALQRVFVNSGTSLYGLSEERLRQRETGAHNTVVVEGKSSSEVWSGFRVARRAKVQLHKIEDIQSKVTLIASHDGYKRLKSKVIHTRKICSYVNSFIICDSLSSKVAAVSYLHLHPDITLERVNKTVLNLVLKNGYKLIVITSHNYSIEDSTWHPEFGKAIPNKKIAIPFSNANLTTEICIAGS